MSQNEQLPPQIQEDLVRLQQLQQTLQVVVTQKQQLELELAETEKALSELDKIADTVPVYKSIGSILLRSDRQGLVNELKEKKELINTRVTVLAKQEERTRERLKELQDRVQQRLKASGASAD
jgi:prefoldin beta subunit